MPTEMVIKIDHLSKSYQLAKGKTKAGIFSGIFGKQKAAPANVDENIFWALKDVSLEIPKGSMVGVLGLNGAGKSTFLKLVSGALQPTSGSIEKSGDVALIELGAGFSPHLTARENIRLLGRQKGISNNQIEEKIDYVEAFADIGLFFDQPLNTYSSGMQSRVSFGNAFSIDPEILIVDEALAVGDASFTNKCFRRIDDLRSRGKSILFASHDRNTVARLCDMGMVIDHGHLKYFGAAKEASFCYEKITDEASRQRNPQIDYSGGGDREFAEGDSNSVPIEGTEWDQSSVPREIVEAFLAEPSNDSTLESRAGFNADNEKLGTGAMEITDFLVYPASPSGQTLRFAKSSTICILLKTKFNIDSSHPCPGIQIKNKQGILLYGANTILKGADLTPARKGDCRVYCFSFDLKFPSAQEYFISLAVASGTNLQTAILGEKREALIRIEVTGEQDSTGICDIPLTIHDTIITN